MTYICIEALGDSDLVRAIAFESKDRLEVLDISEASTATRAIELLDMVFGDFDIDDDALELVAFENFHHPLYA